MARKDIDGAGVSDSGKGVPLLARASKGTGMSLGIVVMGAGLVFQARRGFHKFVSHRVIEFLCFP